MRAHGALMGATRRSRALICLVGACLASATSVALAAGESLVVDPRFVATSFAPDRSERFEPGSSSALAIALREFVDRHGGDWTFRVDRRTDSLALAQGSGVELFRPDDDDQDGLLQRAEVHVRRFLAEHDRADPAVPGPADG